MANKNGFTQPLMSAEDLVKGIRGAGGHMPTKGSEYMRKKKKKKKKSVLAEIFDW